MRTVVGKAFPATIKGNRHYYKKETGDSSGLRFSAGQSAETSFRAIRYPNQARDRIAILGSAYNAISREYVILTEGDRIPIEPSYAQIGATLRSREFKSMVEVIHGILAKTGSRTREGTGT
jgi:hypothetical protein